MGMSARMVVMRLVVLTVEMAGSDIIPTSPPTTQASPDNNKPFLTALPGSQICQEMVQVK